MKTVDVKSRYGNDRVWGRVRMPEEWAGMDCLLELECAAHTGDARAKRTLARVRRMVPEGDTPIICH